VTEAAVCGSNGTAARAGIAAVPTNSPDANAAAGADTISFSSLFNTPQTIGLTTGQLLLTDTATTTITTAATKKVVEQDGVDMVAGYVSSPNAAGNRDYLDSQKIPTLIANAGVNALARARKSPFIFRTSFTQSTAMPKVAR